LTILKELDETLNTISDLNMSAYYSREFKAWREGSVKFLTGDGNFMGVARFAQRRGFVGKRVHAAQSLPPLSPKGKELLGMDGRQNWDRWQVLVEALKELGV
jgi:hypothetical protein